MNKYELNNLGKDWVFEANSEQEATLNYIDQVCGAKNLQDYEKYCEEVNVNSKIQWELYEEEFEGLDLEDQFEKLMEQGE